MDEYGIIDQYLRRLISVCCDGASINMGKHNGVATQLKRLRPWLLVIHCINHRLELAIMDGFKTDAAFSEVNKILLALYLLTLNNGKVKSLLKKIALELDGVCVAFVKSEGTTLHNHKHRDIKGLMVNYLPMCYFNGKLHLCGE